MPAERHLMSRLQLAGLVAGALVAADVGMLLTGQGPFERLQTAAAMLFLTLTAALVVRHRARFRLRTFLIAVPVVGVFAALAGRQVQQMHGRRFTADEITAIGGSYLSHDGHRAYGLVDLGDYHLPASLVDLLGEETFHDLQAVEIPVQSLRDRRLERWSTDQFRAVTLVNEGAEEWPAEELRVVLSAPGLAHLRVTNVATASQVDCLITTLAGRKLRHVEFVFNGPVEAETLAHARELPVSPRFVFNSVLLTEEVAEVLSTMPGERSISIQNSFLESETLPWLLRANSLELLDVVVSAPRAKESSVLTSAGALTTRLHLRWFQASDADIINQMLSLQSLDTLRVEKQPLTAAQVREIAASKSLVEARIGDAGMSSPEVEKLFLAAEPHETGDGYLRFWESRGHGLFVRGEQPLSD